MLESFQTGKFEYKKLSPEEQQKRGILGRLVGIIADYKAPTRNGRKYSADLWEQVFNDDIMKERINNRCCFGELGHPADREETDMSKVAICLAEVPKKGADGKLYGVFDILSTPNGQILKSLCDYGCNIGVSSRGSGDLITDRDGNEAVDPRTYDCQGWDAVLIPAVKEARMEYVTESLNKTRYHKTLKESLQKTLSSANEADKVAMLEGLKSLGIDLNEEENSSGVINPDGTPASNEDVAQAIEYFYGSDIPDSLTTEEMQVALDYWYSKNDPEELADNVDIQDEAFDIGEQAMPTAAAMDRCYDLGKQFVDHFDKIYNDTSEETIKHRGSEMQAFLDKVLAIKLKSNNKPLNEKQIYDWFITLGSLPVDLFDNDVEADVYTDFTNDLLDNDKDVLEALRRCELLNETYNKKDIEDASLDIENEDLSELADDNDVAMVEELQSALMRINELEKQVMELQEKLSVSYAKETNLTESVSSYKNAISNLTKRSAQTDALKQKVDELGNKLNESISNCDDYKSQLDKLQKYNKQLIEASTSKSSHIKSLNEAYKTLEEEKNKSDAEINTLKGEINTLTENLETSKKDAELQLAESKRKLEKSNKIAENYKTIANKAVGKYISSQATRLGVSENEIKNKLPESYTFSDIDKVCEDLRAYQLSVAKLPFNTLTEDLKVKVSPSQKEAIKAPVNTADDIDNQLLQLAGIKL